MRAGSSDGREARATEGEAPEAVRAAGHAEATFRVAFPGYREPRADPGLQAGEASGATSMRDPDESGVWLRHVELTYRVFRPQSDARTEFARQVAEMWHDELTRPVLRLVPPEGQ